MKGVMKGLMRVFLAMNLTLWPLLMLHGFASGSQTGGMSPVDIRLPSDSTGEGTLAVRVYAPSDASRFRYGPEGGAPAMVIVPGGFHGGVLALENAGVLVGQGFVVLTFLFPGGTDQGISSDGDYDQRGDRSQRALRDVLCFAAGEMRDFEGRSIEALVGGKVRADLVGMMALSNGGSISITTLGRYGDQIPPLAYLVSWESPTNDQILAEELGTHSRDPNPNKDSDGDGISDNDVVNGAYQGYGFPQVQMDYTRLAYDPEALFSQNLNGTVVTYKGLFFFDNNGDGRFNAWPPGSLFSDTNGNDTIDPNEDYALPGIPMTPDKGEGGPRILSVAATHALGKHFGFFQWPPHYAGPVQCSLYWAVRDAARWFPQAMARQPGLKGMSIFGKRDHVQTTRDHAHILHYLDGFGQASHWFRLNPDRVYVEAIIGVPCPHVVDNTSK